MDFPSLNEEMNTKKNNTNYNNQPNKPYMMQQECKTENIVFEQLNEKIQYLDDKIDVFSQTV